jgi:hypothetical protein
MCGKFCIIWPIITLAVGCTASHDTSAADNANESEKVSSSRSDQSPSGKDQSAAAGAPATAVATGSGQAPPSATSLFPGFPGFMVSPPTFDTDNANTTADDDQIKFEMNIKVAAGAELHRCMYARFPDDRGVIAVPSVESHYTVGSHHMLAYRTELTAIPAGKEGLLDCFDGGASRNERGSYYEAQEPDVKRDLPKGIAHEFQPGEVLVLEAHYINTTDKDVDAHIELITHTMNPDDVEQEAGTIYFNDTNINVPPHGTAHSQMTCTLTQDISLAQLWSHMHARGVNFVVETDDQGARDALGTLYTETDWAEPKPRIYPSDPPVVLHSGTHISFGCDFKNDSDMSFKFGQSAETNEMCILHGMYWPRMPRASEQCMGGVTSRM